MEQDEYQQWGIEGEWVPRLASELDFTRLTSLGAKAGFLLSRIDGTTTISQLCSISGMPHEEALGMIAQMLEQGVLRCEEATPPKAPASNLPPVQESAAYSTERAPSGSHVKAAASPPPVKPRNITVDIRQQAEIEAEYERVQKGSYFEVLKTHRSATRREIKAAYYALCKVFHPDVLYGEELGALKAKIEGIYHRYTEAYQLLGDERRRKEYVDKLEREERNSEGDSGPKNPLLFGQGFAANPLVEKAQSHFKAGQEALGAGNWTEALNNFQLAKTFHCADPELEKLIRRASVEVSKAKAAKLLAKATGAWELGKRSEAAETFREAAEMDKANPKIQYAAALHMRKAEMASEEILPVAQRAVDLSPMSIESRELLAELMAETGRIAGAIRQFETLLAQDKRHPYAGRRLRELKKMKERG